MPASQNHPNIGSPSREPATLGTCSAHREEWGSLAGVSSAHIEQLAGGEQPEAMGDDEMTQQRNNEIGEDVRVCAGEGDDYDEGYFDHWEDGMAVVRWDSGVVSAVPREYLRTLPRQ